MAIWLKAFKPRGVIAGQEQGQTRAARRQCEISTAVGAGLLPIRCQGDVRKVAGDPIITMAHSTKLRRSMMRCRARATPAARRWQCRILRVEWLAGDFTNLACLVGWRWKQPTYFVVRRPWCPWIGRFGGWWRGTKLGRSNRPFGASGLGISSVNIPSSLALQ